jgi:hypothetical protein
MTLFYLKCPFNKYLCADSGWAFIPTACVTNKHLMHKLNQHGEIDTSTLNEELKKWLVEPSKDAILPESDTFPAIKEHHVTVSSFSVLFENLPKTISESKFVEHFLSFLQWSANTSHNKSRSNKLRKIMVTRLCSI